MRPLALNNAMLAIFLLLLLPSLASGFAAWLKCNRQLEGDEVIMNNKVRHADEESDALVVKLAIYDESGKRIDVASDKGGGAIVWIDKDATQLSFKIGLDQSTLSGLTDIQYVVESTPFNVSPSPRPRPAPSPNVPTIHSSNNKHSNAKRTSSFTGASGGGGVLCDGRRAHARGKNGSVNYTLVPNEGRSTSKDGIVAEIWGGWSEYHGAVTLTPRIIFKRKDEIGQDHQGEL
ncbi:hypothetical protein ACHAWT_010960 [Skeletonema menzelii]|eukprot:scaffold2763_cov155-Skeletonema_menzelii.AAC.4